MPPTPAHAYEFIDLTAAPPPLALDWLHTATRALLTKSFDDAVNHFLAPLGEAANADRSWVFIYSHDGSSIRFTHEWCRPGIPSFIGTVQDTPTTMIAWLQPELARNCAVMINDVEQLPRSAEAIRSKLRHANVWSALCVPVFHEDRLWGCIGFETVARFVPWSAEIAHALQLCGKLIPLAASAAEKTRAPGDAPKTGGFYLHGANGLQHVTLERIAGVRAEGDYTRTYLDDGQTFLELRPLKTWLGLLPHDRFIQVHRSALINLRHVRALHRTRTGQWSVQLANLAASWIVAKKYHSDVRGRLGV